MATEPKVISASWTAFVKDKTCLGYREFEKGGKYFGTLTLISKPTEAELKAELKRLKISLPK
ncbi:hypothetical protein UFOVP460_9 [uncultured Caudovirales phage]|uniref:Uncharacterized protein n=1 Tax=uncultured Caudovirales phage TaxID=2100421 RepID=A0A6J5MB94_9CAUD|nr:hypothetical protein UFOVP460_9 [uncultured Caudovirales phage]